MRLNPCQWVAWDSTGRPSCEHGPAHKAGNRWRCSFKNTAASRRYDRTEKGRETLRRCNASANARSSKQLYELTRVRVS